MTQQRIVTEKEKKQNQNEETIRKQVVYCFSFI